MQNQSQRQRTFRANLIALNPQLRLTFSYKSWVTIDQIRADIIRFGDRTQQEVLGNQLSRFSETERLSLIGVAENLDTKPRIYTAVLGHPFILEFLHSSDAIQLWGGVSESCGQLKATKMRNLPATASYFHARLHLHDTVDRSIRYAPWRPAHRGAARR